ncbi:unnamed protein product [Blepharisma stoltei]|uniref:Uncharacterized protein n=1 Tax=Blepharisma stoltei TaxID=1481888 RepID=A0AAU9JBS6_9CILI|nr:unnamed protein product [Blepharisma stoltei]
MSKNVSFYSPDLEVSAQRKTRRLRDEFERSVDIDKELLKSMQADIKRAETVADNLREEKAKLKSALADSLEKRDELYNKAIEFKRSRDEALMRSEYLEEKLKDLKFAQSDIELLRKQIISRDALIKELSEKIKKIQSEGDDRNPWRDTFGVPEAGKNEYCNYREGIEDEIMAVGMYILRNIQEFQLLNFAFKKSFATPSDFKDLLEGGQWDKAFLKTLRFIEELIMIQKSETRQKKTYNLDSDPRQSPEKRQDSRQKRYNIEQDHHKISTPKTKRAIKTQPSTSPASSNTPNSFAHANSYLSTSINDENYHKLMDESQTLLESLSHQNLRISKLNQQINETMNLTNKPTPKTLKLSASNPQLKVDTSKAKLQERKKNLKLDLSEPEINSTSRLISPKDTLSSSRGRSKSKTGKPRNNMGPSSERVMPIMRKADGWESVEDFFGSRDQTK